MVSSTGEEPRTSQIVANATPMVTMEAKMVVATGRDHCHQLKDMLGKEDPSTMVVVMATSNQTSTPQHRLPVTDARLVAAACSGSFQDLESLLNGQDQRAASIDGAIGSSAMLRASGDEEAFLKELLLEAVTAGGDTLLHVVAGLGDCEDFLNTARIIHSNEQNLLFVVNNKGDTPLHCAARAANSQMVSLLIGLAKDQGNNANRVKALLETENNTKGTALHEAVRIGNNDTVKLLMKEDPQLACFPKDGTSPLYLAIQMENKTIAETLYKESGGILSYSGPNGQNALHAAVLRGKDLTKMLLQWNNDLAMQQDEKGNTPLHFAASVPGRGDQRTICSQVLKANPDALYQMDHDGLLPIHVAASVGAREIITDFLEKSPTCAGFPDARGRTFLHVAVEKRKISIVDHACKTKSLSWILNMQDKNGNTALHQAVQARNLPMFCPLFGNGQVHLNLTNGKGETPLGIAHHNLPEGMYYSQRSEVKIHLALKHAGAKMGICRQDYIEENKKKQDEMHKTDMVKDATQNLCIGSVLVATVAFGATFAMPGGYISAEDHINGGTPTLAGRYAFDAFTMANALAFTLSATAIVALMSSGSPFHNTWNRLAHVGMAAYCLSVSVTSLVSAFALATYTMLGGVAHKTAIAICVLSSLALLYRNFMLTIKNIILIVPLSRRKGMVWTLLWSLFFIMSNVLIEHWPIIIIFCSTARKYHLPIVQPPVQPPTPLP